MTMSTTNTTTPTDALYQTLVLDHARAPRNRGALAGATHGARGDNPFCGDRFTVSLILEDDTISEARFEGSGCAVATAAASMMTVAITGLTRDAAQALARRFEDLLANGVKNRATEDTDAALGDLDAFAGVRRFPVRVKCARLPWQTLTAALARASETVSTE
jgi:nitrogen fixation NifU-like protein